jgi:hypothetical protein
MEDNSIYLYWETEPDVDNEFFIVERSADLAIWQGLKTIVRTGSSAAVLQYFYVDAYLASGSFYYRLKMVNRSGDLFYSNVVSAIIAPGSMEINTPEPDGKSNQLFIGGLTNTAEWEVSVLSSAASLTLKPAFLNENILKVPEEHSGVYLLKLRNRLDGSSKTIRFLKK